MEEYQPANVSAAAQDFLVKGWPVRVVVGVTCILSLFGSLLIILSYVCFKNLRTRAREILLHISLMDFGVAAANLVGDAVYFDQYYRVYSDQEKPGVFYIENPSKTVHGFCEAQAFFGVYFTLGSVLWTIALAAHLYFVLVYRKYRNARYFLLFSYLSCYGMPLFLSLWLVFTNRLGYSPYDSAGWCAIILVDPETRETDMYAAVMGYDLWIYLALILVPVIYISARGFVKDEQERTKDFISAARFWAALNVLEYKLFLIPLAFTILRIWSCLINIFYVYSDVGSSWPRGVTVALIYLSGMGDSGQGFANVILFVVFTRQVRRTFTSRFRRRERQTDSEDDELDHAMMTKEHDQERKKWASSMMEETPSSGTGLSDFTMSM